MRPQQQGRRSLSRPWPVLPRLSRRGLSGRWLSRLGLSGWWLSGWWLSRLGQPSRTGQLVAMARAELPRPRTPAGDPAAQARLCAGMPAARELPLAAHLAARTRFFDEQVLAALGRRVRQVVILGAGYDDRALRFRAPGPSGVSGVSGPSGVTYFEVDHPATLADKRRRLRRMRADTGGLVQAAADFRDDDVAAVLAAAGQDPSQPSLFLCEGVLVYLDTGTLTRLLAALRSRAAPGSTLAASLAIHREGLDSAMVVAGANARRRNGAAEPWRTILPRDEQLGLITAAGWSVTAAVSDAELGTGAPGRSVLVTAVSSPPG
jgi:methyltransferase (TIGR00027 family)